MLVLLAATHIPPWLWMKARYNPWLRDNVQQRHSNTEKIHIGEKYFYIEIGLLVNKIQDIIQKITYIRFPTYLKCDDKKCHIGQR